MALSRFHKVSLAVNVVLLGAVVLLWSEPGTLMLSLLQGHVDRKISFFDSYAVSAGDTVFVGDSITEGALWAEMFPALSVKNRGIGGDTTSGVLNRLHQVTAGKPQAVFLKVGTNDLTRQPFDPQASYSRYAMIVQRIQQESPSTVIVVQSLLPRAAAHRAEVEAFNQQIEQIAAAAGVTFVNLYPHFLADDGSIGDDLSNDELHLTGSGYRLWQEVLAPVLALQAQGQPASR